MTKQEKQNRLIELQKQRLGIDAEIRQLENELSETDAEKIAEEMNRARDTRINPFEMKGENQ
jgi:alcohol dehydrogenase class IV